MKSHFNIIKFIKGRGIKYEEVTGSKGEILLSCPVCNKYHHFYYNKFKNMGTCHRCKWSCNGAGYLIEAFGISRKEALKIFYGEKDASADGLLERVRELMDESRAASGDLDFGDIVFRTPIPKGSERITRYNMPEVFLERKINSFVAKRANSHIYNHLGRYRRRIIFPFNVGKTETFTAVTSFTKKDVEHVKKIYKKKGMKFMKSLHPKGSFMSEVLYLYELAKDSHSPLVVVEGVWDTLTLIGCEINAMGSLHSGISEKQAFLLSNTKSDIIYWMPDGDVPTEVVKKSHKLLSEICAGKTIRTSLLPKGVDPDNLSKFEVEEFLAKGKRFLI